MEQAISTAAALGMQLLFFAAALLTSVGFYQVFMTAWIVKWPWVKVVKQDKPQDFDFNFRRGVAAGLFYYAHAVERHGIGNTQAIAHERDERIRQSIEAVEPEHRAAFDGGTREGVILCDNLMSQVRVQTLTHHMPDIQAIVTQADAKLMQAIVLSKGRVSNILTALRTDLSRLQGITQ